MKAAGCMWLAVLVAIAVFELIAVRRKAPTLSQWVWAQQARHRWLAYLVMVSMTLLMIHFFVR